ncbi:Alkaline ceramidase 3 [Golovinomyces cichoracearum]|uniref:Alkaline ceramidase 3 n=1 Tax=Golovinomyces cichoracearum TaxID=62708 RepID=A0A420HAC0_9PEZI|nr:Alkaline ceramidase 3 [Golovinomyces cichoracearum]
MGFSIPAYDYPQSSLEDGYWAPVTSTINWCEGNNYTTQNPNYYATRYSAEIVNTLTNILFIILGIKGLRNCMKYKHDSVFAVAFTGYLVVGIGSFAFHATLKCSKYIIELLNSMQLVDELSMIYTVCLMCYATFSYARSRLFQQILGFSLLFLSISITVRHSFETWIDKLGLIFNNSYNPTFHQVAFAILITVVLLRSMYLMEFKIRRSLRERHASVLQKNLDVSVTSKCMREVRRDLDILNRMWVMVGFGLMIFLAGFAIWNLDNKYCLLLRHWRHQIGLPWGILLEGHGWWYVHYSLRSTNNRYAWSLMIHRHLMTGLGTYIYIVWGVWLRYYLDNRQRDFGLRWPSLFFSLPEVVSFSQVEGMTVAKNK